MFTRINSGGIWAVEGVPGLRWRRMCPDGLPGFSISGQLASEVKGVPGSGQDSP